MSTPLKVGDETSAGLREEGEKKIVSGVIWGIGGILLTGISYLAAESGQLGYYWVFFGAIIYGAIQLKRGIVLYTRGTPNDPSSRHAVLNEADTCPACGKLIPLGSSECPECGKKYLE